MKNKESKKINLFINGYCLNYSNLSKTFWRSRLKRYFEIIGITDIDKYIDKKEDSKYCDDIIKFNMLTKDTLAPLTRTSIISTVKSFLEFNDIKFSPRDLKILKSTKHNPQTISEGKCLTNKQLKSIIEESNNSYEKSIYTLIAHSGLRVSEALSLELNDIDYNCNPPLIHVRKGKFGKERYTFLSRDAKKYLDKYLSDRDDFLKTINNYAFSKRYNKDKKVDNRIYPFSMDSVERRWSKLLERTKDKDLFKKNGYRVEYRIHSLRKFFITRMLVAGVEQAIVDKMVGHGTKLNKIYTLPEIEDLRQSYIKGENHLSLENNTELKEVQKNQEEKITELERIIKEQRELINNVPKKLIESIKQEQEKKFSSLGESRISQSYKTKSHGIMGEMPSQDGHIDMMIDELLIKRLEKYISESDKEKKKDKNR